MHDKITKADILDKFIMADKKIYLKSSSSRPFTLNLPLILNEDLAKIAAMILDGCIYKNLNGFTFSQKKDKSKAIEFKNIIKNCFGVDGKIRIDKSQTYLVAYSTVTDLARFLGLSTSLLRISAT